MTVRGEHEEEEWEEKKVGREKVSSDQTRRATRRTEKERTNGVVLNQNSGIFRKPLVLLEIVTASEADHDPRVSLLSTPFSLSPPLSSSSQLSLFVHQRPRF